MLFAPAHRDMTLVPQVCLFHIASACKLQKHQQYMSRSSSDTENTQNCSDRTRDPSVIDWRWIFVLSSQWENKDKKIHKTENQKCRRMTDIQLANWVCHSQGYSPRGGFMVHIKYLCCHGGTCFCLSWIVHKDDAQVKWLVNTYLWLSFLSDGWQKE